MSYTKTVWKNGEAPAINANNLTNIENGIENIDEKFIEKPSTATDKNIAVFDTNQNKLKDGGKSLADVTPFSGAMLSLNTTRYLLPGWNWVDIGETSADDGRIYYTPILVAEETKFDAVGLYVDGAIADSSVSIRLYKWDNGLPGDLIKDFGSVDTTTTGAKEIEDSFTLSTGYYFIASRATKNPTLVGMDVGTRSSTVPPITPYSNTLNGNGRLAVLYVDDDFADPAPAPTDETDARWVFIRFRIDEVT